MSGMFRRETAAEPEVKNAGQRPGAWKLQHLLALPEPGHHKTGKEHLLPGLLVCLAPSVFSVYLFYLSSFTYFFLWYLPLAYTFTLEFAVFL